MNSFPTNKPSRKNSSVHAAVDSISKTRFAFFIDDQNKELTYREAKDAIEKAPLFLQQVMLFRLNAARRSADGLCKKNYTPKERQILRTLNRTGPTTVDRICLSLKEQEGQNVPIKVMAGRLCRLYKNPTKPMSKWPAKGNKKVAYGLRGQALPKTLDRTRASRSCCWAFAGRVS